MEMTLPDGEALQGEYSVVAGDSLSVGNAFGTAYGLGDASSVSATSMCLKMAGSGAGQASLFGNRGTSFHCEFVNNNMKGHGYENADRPRAEFIPWSITRSTQGGRLGWRGMPADGARAGRRSRALKAPSRCRARRSAAACVPLADELFRLTPTAVEQGIRRHRGLAGFALAHDENQRRDRLARMLAVGPHHVDLRLAAAAGIARFTLAKRLQVGIAARLGSSLSTGGLRCHSAPRLARRLRGAMAGR
jgi:hypothetical protein